MLWRGILAMVLGITLTGGGRSSPEGSTSVHAFNIREGLLNNTPDDTSDDLLDAGRWPHLPESLVTGGIRGLGGGIEWSLAENFCDRLIPRFADTPRPNCDQIRTEIQAGLMRWTTGHPFLAFTEVTGHVAVDIPARGEPRPWLGHGAELDLYAMAEDDYPSLAYPDSVPLRGRATRTRLWVSFEPPLGTNGRALPGRSITAVDHYFNLTACFYMNPAIADTRLDGRPCNHFQSVIVLLGGRVLGLGSADLDPGRYFDMDDDPTNGMAIDCERPLAGLRLAPNVDRAAVMIVNLGLPRPVSLTLTPDDLAGRDFLYPVCPGYG